MLPYNVSAQTTAPTAPKSQSSAPSGKYNGLAIGELTRSVLVLNAPGGKKVKSWWAGRRVLLYQVVPDARGVSWYRVSEAPEAPMYV